MNYPRFARIALFALVMPISSLSFASESYGREGTWTVRGWLGVVCRCVEDDNVTFTDPTFGTVALEVDGTSFGLGVDFERRFNNRLGLDFALGYTQADVDFSHSVGSGVQTDSLGILPVWFALNIHLWETEKFDFYVGPQVAYVFYLDDLSFNVPGIGTYEFPTGNEFPSWGFNLGADYWVNKDWALNFNFRFVDSDADSEHDLPVDPTFVTIGFTRHF